MIALVIALVAVLLGGRETARGVVKDDSFDLAIAVAQDAAFEGEENETTDGADTPVLDGSLTEDPKILSSRDDAVGRHDGVHGAPLLVGFEFEGWAPEQVQELLNQGWTVEQLREKYNEEKQ